MDPNTPESHGQSGEQMLPIVDRLSLRFESYEEATVFVQRFWKAVYAPVPEQYESLERGIRQSGGDWGQELTDTILSTDRSSIVKGRVGPDRGKWLVMLRGNHNPLSKQATRWLREEGLIKESSDETI